MNNFSKAVLQGVIVKTDELKNLAGIKQKHKDSKGSKKSKEQSKKSKESQKTKFKK